MTSDYCSACGGFVEVVEKKILGNMKEVVCSAHFHFIKMVPDR